ncbi:hypothetical protein QJQ45_008579 [Haematococcus lacustris]|nr:hypothetical protein QJQ45_008579 [Haematococcus lacustris]
MREEVLRLAGPVYTSRVQPGASVSACQYCPRSTITDNFDQGCRRLPAGNTAAVELCTLLLTDQEVLDVVLCLHDIRAAQLWNLLPSTRARLPPPVFSGAFARRLSQRQRSASGDHLDMFVEALGRDTIVEGDPLLGVWDSMHRVMLLVLAALQSLPFRPHPQHPDPAATTHTSTTTQLPPGYHRCSACLLLSLCLALRSNMHYLDQLEGFDQHPARAAAGAEHVRRIIVLDVRDHCQDVATYPTDKVTTSCPDHLARLLSSSPVVTGWPGPPPVKLSSNHSSAAGASSGLGPTSISSSRGWGRSKVQGSSQGQSGKGSSTACPKALAVVNSFAHVAQALCAVLGRQEEGLIMDQLISTCKAQGPESWSGLQEGASFLASTAMGVMTREIFCLDYVVRILKAAVAQRRLGAVASDSDFLALINDALGSEAAAIAEAKAAGSPVTSFLSTNEVAEGSAAARAVKTSSSAEAPNNPKGSEGTEQPAYSVPAYYDVLDELLMSPGSKFYYAQDVEAHAARYVGALIALEEEVMAVKQAIMGRECGNTED